MNFAQTGWNIKQDVEDRVRIAMGAQWQFLKSFEHKPIYVYRITDEQRQSLGMVGFVKIYRLVKLFMV